MTPQEADSIAYALMTALRTVSMLERERTDATAAVNALFARLCYGHAIDPHGGRVESKREGPVMLHHSKSGLGSAVADALLAASADDLDNKAGRANAS